MQLYRKRTFLDAQAQFKTRQVIDGPPGRLLFAVLSVLPLYKDIVLACTQVAGKMNAALT